MPKTPDDQLLASGEVAAMLGVSAERVRQFAKDGRLPCRQTVLGRLFAPEDVARLMAERRTLASRDRRMKASV